MTDSRLTWGSEKIAASRPTAVNTTESGNWTNTAPAVPPKTIIAAVGCSIWEMVPPSSSKPPMMPTKPNSTPPTLALSTLLSFAFLVTFRRQIHDRKSSGTHPRPAHHGGEQLATKLDHPIDYLLHSFLHQKFLAIQQGDDSVRVLLDSFN